MGRLILVLGAARSGKSTYAERLAHELGEDRVLYVATAEAKDEEMRLRAKNHQAIRPATWRTLESPQDVGQAIQKAAGGARAILVDCLTVLVSNRLLAAAGPEEAPFDAPRADPFDDAIEVDVLAEVEALAACARKTEAHMIIVSNEVGMGVVPPYELGRAYRDLLGRANQAVAHHADEVYLLVAGIPMRVK